jgi:acyl-CoA reductase-like NAD-dependent aldehyde dehydrogenase
MKIAKISFTGSIGSGRKVQQAASKPNLKVVTLEHGNTLSNAILLAPSN